MNAHLNLLTLPPELRSLIWCHLFTSTTLASGELIIEGDKTTTYKPALHSLAILRVCRQINNETKGVWLGQVLFDFTDIVWFLNKLTAVSAEVLSQIRYIRVGGSPLILSPKAYYDDVYDRLAEALILIPGMQLDTLTVVTTGQSPEIVYDTVEGLIEEGDGFRELRVVLPSPAAFAFKETQLASNNNLDGQRRRKPQPRTWLEKLERRDGKGVGAAVSIYQSKKSGVIPDEWNLKDTIPFAQVSSPGFGVAEDADLMSGPSGDKGLVVVARRGKNAVITQGRGKPPFNLQDLRDWTYGLSWEEVKEISNRWMGDLRDDSEEWKFEDELPSAVPISEIPRTGHPRGG